MPKNRVRFFKKDAACLSFAPYLLLNRIIRSARLDAWLTGFPYLGANVLREAEV